MRVAVLGGGIQGTCVAMELVSRGVTVELIEAESAVMSGASRHNEGKIHLGYIYANDRSMRTAGLQMRGAAAFQPLMQRWLGARFSDVPISTMFDYAVHENSLLTPGELAETYQEISRRVREIIEPGSYLGVEDPHVVDRIEAGKPEYYGAPIEAAFSTREVAVDPDALADLMVSSIGEAPVQLHLNETVRSIDLDDRKVELQGPEGTTRHLGPYDHIVNATWGGRPAIDASIGMYPTRPWSFRMKYFTRCALPGDREVRSTSIVLGGFGDVVNYRTGELYISWYPAARRGWSTELSPPQWPTRPSRTQANLIASSMLDGISPVVPVLGSLRLDEPFDVRGGIIYAFGATDVDDPTSQLHERFDVGTTSKGRYHSIDTGKYTTAPLFAVQAADRVTESEL